MNQNIVLDIPDNLLTNEYLEEMKSQKINQYLDSLTCKKLQCKEIKAYYEEPFYYSDECSITVYKTNEGNKFILYWSPTGSRFVFNSWNEVKAKRMMLINRWKNLESFPSGVNVFNSQRVTVYNNVMYYDLIRLEPFLNPIDVNGKPLNSKVWAKDHPESAAFKEYFGGAKS